MQYLIKTGYDGAYSKVRCNPISRERLMSAAADEAAADQSGSKYLISGLLPTGARRRDWLWSKITGNESHVPILDCDGLEQMVAAVHWLRTEHELGCAAIESSPSHFWVVADAAVSWQKMIELVADTPGVDQKYVSLCRSSGACYLRALPDARLFRPVFQDAEFRNRPVADWYSELMQHWHSPDMDQYFKRLSLLVAIANGTIMERAADPGFAL